MTALPIVQRQRGEPLSIGLQASGDDSLVGITVSAALKRASRATYVLPADSDPVLATFDVTFTAAAGDVPAFWTLTLTAAQTEALELGNYITDAKLVRGGVVIERTKPVVIAILGRITP